MVRLKIISLYIYIKNYLRSNESRDQHHEDGDLVPSPRYGFSYRSCFSALRRKINHFRKEMLFSGKFVVFPLIYEQAYIG